MNHIDWGAWGFLLFIVFAATVIPATLLAQNDFENLVADRSRFAVFLRCLPWYWLARLLLVAA